MLRNLKYKIKKYLLNIRYWLIIKLISDAPVIVNCTVYNDVLKYNTNKRGFYIYKNNKVKSIEAMIENEIRRFSIDSSMDNVLRKGNSFVLDLHKREN